LWQFSETDNILLRRFATLSAVTRIRGVRHIEVIAFVLPPDMAKKQRHVVSGVRHIEVIAFVLPPDMAKKQRHVVSGVRERRPE
jgi:hypothetical protein